MHLSAAIGGAFETVNNTSTLNSCDNCQSMEREVAWYKGQISFLWEAVQNLHYQVI
ncbi:hypothetical protein DPMN_192546 [Dreissena polymorpha]|uniref:Uncharacterized protein n=1 Tax=Dreissena polymorpha TaxID=45954 RepID=A0A9D3Y7B3_DREPO|nr:hypothetical protein DPMN_192546 [Dreissena polymorpha]